MSGSGLLTRKQSWRRQSKATIRKDHDFLYSEGVGYNIKGDYPIRSSSEPVVSDLQSISQLGRLWATTGNLMSNGLKKNVITTVKQRVRFQALVRVVLIPSRDEYAVADLLDILWWGDSDYLQFKTSAVKELKAVMDSNKIWKSEDAIKILYQPGYSDYDFEDKAIIQHPDTSSLGINERVSLLSSCDVKKYKESSTGIFEARTDVDLTDLKRHNATECGIEDLRMIHPLAYMCE